MLRINTKVFAGVANDLIRWNASVPVFISHTMRSLANAVKTEFSIPVLIFCSRPKPTAVAALCFSKEAFKSFFVHSNYTFYYIKAIARARIWRIFV